MLPLERPSNLQQFLPLLIVILFGFFIFGGLTSVAMDTPKLILLHGLFEIASIILGFIIFYITWFGTNTNNGILVTTVSLVIFSSSIFELVHMLAYPGIATDALSSERIWVTAWVASRLIWSFGMLYTACLLLTTNRFTFISNKLLLYCTLVAVTALVANIMFGCNSLPGLNIAHYNLLSAVYCQWAALFADTLALFVLNRYCSSLVGKLPQLALVFGALSDLAFCLAIHSPYNLNIAGHFFRVLANFYILRSLYLLAIRQPYDEVIRLKVDMEELAAKNANLYKESEHQRNLVEDTLAKIGMLISSQLDLEETLSAIADMVADMMRARQSAIALYANKCSALQVAATYGINAPPEYIPLTNSLAGQVCETKTALFIDDLTLHPELFRPQLVFSTIRSIICAPLVNDQEIIGVIEAYSSEKKGFTQRDALLLKALGYHAGAAIASALLYEQTKIRLNEEKFLFQIVQDAAATIDIDAIIEKCTTHVATALDADTGIGLLVAGPQKNMLVVKTALGLDFKPFSFEMNCLPEMVELISAPAPRATTALHFPPFKELVCDCPDIPIMLIPLPVNHQLLGLIIIGWRRFVSREQLQRTSFAALMGQQIALGLEKAQLYNQVKAMALSDGLTGLANRRNFDLFLNTELRRATTLKRPLSLIMLDLDKFKIYNDTYGHTVGDRLLAELGKILQQSLRGIDFPARYGGEEFAIILPECNNAEALSLAEKIRWNVEAGHFPDNSGGFSARITASLGVATFDPTISAPPPDIACFVATADEALYQAKNQGRNQVGNSGVM